MAAAAAATLRNVKKSKEIYEKLFFISSFLLSLSLLCG